MRLSYWEYKTWFSKIDFTIVGSGIVGLTTAIFLKEKYPNAKVLILEKGILPQGASTKNAGFACFGSISEIISDLENHDDKEVFQLVKQRVEGIDTLRRLLGDGPIGFEQNGGHEIFLDRDIGLYEKCQKRIPEINAFLRPIFRDDPFHELPNQFGFQGVQKRYITHRFEGQLDAGKMMWQLLQKAQEKGIIVLNGMAVTAFEDNGDAVHIEIAGGELSTKKLLVATNGFAGQLLNKAVKPARAQVLVTRPIKNLHVKGTFSFDEGYYYFRNIDDRILFGGGRNLDFISEETTDFGTTAPIQIELKRLLTEIVLPDQEFEIDRSWSGIMGVGRQKNPIIEQLSENVYCGIRLGGMGVAIGSLVGKQLANFV